MIRDGRCEQRPVCHKGKVAKYFKKDLRESLTFVIFITPVIFVKFVTSKSNVEIKVQWNVKFLFICKFLVTYCHSCGL